MDGMRWQTVRTGGNVTVHIEIPTASTIGEISMNGYFDGTDPNQTFGAFDRCQFFDDDFKVQTQDLGGSAAFSRNNMANVDLTLSASDDCAAEYIINLFFWPSVS